MALLNCNDLSGTASLLQWLDHTGQVVISSTTSPLILTISQVLDSHHGVTYTCRVNTSSGIQDLNSTIFVVGMLLCSQVLGRMYKVIIKFFPLY